MILKYEKKQGSGEALKITNFSVVRIDLSSCLDLYFAAMILDPLNRYQLEIN